MIDIVYTQRVIESKDWASMLFILCFVLITVNKAIFGNRFVEFTKLGFSNKYIKIYKDSSNLLSWFTISFFIIQVVSFAFLIQLLLSYFGLAEKTNVITYIQIVTFLCAFILSKYLIEKIIAVAFNIEEFNDRINLYKVSYRTYIGFLLLPINAILFYNQAPPVIMIFSIIGLILTASIISYGLSLKIHQKFIIDKLFYFILYLCALEIAPYYFIYYWFTKT